MAACRGGRTHRRVAPLGDPMEFELIGYRLSLRKSEAACVSVEAA